MAVFRVQKTQNYTIMSNHHLRNKTLSLKAKGLLSLMLSLPEDWDYTTRGLASICKEGVDSVCATVRELEAAGYIIRRRIAKELRRKYPALLQAPGALDAEIMRVLLYPNREQEQAFDRYLLGLEVQHYIDISGLDSYDKFYLEHISCRWEWDYLRESIREETPQPQQGTANSKKLDAPIIPAGAAIRCGSLSSQQAP